MGVTIKWYGPSVDRKLRKGMADNTESAAKYFRDEIRILLSVQGPPRSKAWQPPHREFGDLVRSYKWEIDRRNLHARVGSGLLKNNAGTEVARARYLEFGTSRMDPRPHIRPTLYNKSREIGMRWAAPL
jgi:hypothetical protein